jgi:hypothetical protein
MGICIGHEDNRTCLLIERIDHVINNLTPEITIEYPTLFIFISYPYHHPHGIKEASSIGLDLLSILHIVQQQK